MATIAYVFATRASATPERIFINSDNTYKKDDFQYSKSRADFREILIANFNLDTVLATFGMLRKEVNIIPITRHEFLQMDWSYRRDYGPVDEDPYARGFSLEPEPVPQEPTPATPNVIPGAYDDEGPF